MLVSASVATARHAHQIELNRRALAVPIPRRALPATFAKDLNISLINTHWSCSQGRLFRLITKEVLIELASFLSLQDLLSFLKSCKSAQVVSSNPRIWSRLAIRFDIYPNSRASIYHQLKVEIPLTKKIVACLNAIIEPHLLKPEPTSYRKLLRYLHLTQDFLAPHLHFFANAGLLECVKIIVESRSCTHIHRGWAMIIALKQGHLDIANFLLRYGTLSILDRGYGVHIAVELSYFEFIETLLTSGPIRELERGLALQAAANAGHEAMALRILQTGPISRYIREGVFLICARDSYANLLKALLDSGPISAVCRKEALAIALSKGHTLKVETPACCVIL